MAKQMRVTLDDFLGAARSLGNNAGVEVANILESQGYQGLNEGRIVVPIDSATGKAAVTYVDLSDKAIAKAVDYAAKNNDEAATLTTPDPTAIQESGANTSLVAQRIREQLVPNTVTKGEGMLASTFNAVYNFFAGNKYKPAVEQVRG